MGFFPKSRINNTILQDNCASFQKSKEIQKYCNICDKSLNEIQRNQEKLDALTVL